MTLLSWLNSNHLTKEEKHRNLAVNTIKGQQALLLFTYLWLLYKAYNYYILTLRPEATFVGVKTFWIEFKNLPSPFIFISLFIIAIVSLTTSVINIKYTLSRFILLFCLLLLNLPEWGYGHTAHVNHFFLICHLFGAIIPNRLKSNNSIEESHKLFTYYFLGILTPYLISGLWKWIGLFYKIIFKPNDVHWLHSKAAYFNAFLQFDAHDIDIRNLLPIYQTPYIWQILFMFYLFLMSIIIIAAYKQVLLPWAGLFLISFHLLNTIAFNIPFYTAPITLACIFFPYHLFFKKEKINIILKFNSIENKNLTKTINSYN